MQELILLNEHGEVISEEDIIKDRIVSMSEAILARSDTLIRFFSKRYVEAWVHGSSLMMSYKGREYVMVVSADTAKPWRIP
jgi:hypothetical protein